MVDQLGDYRAQLVALGQKGQEAYDKTVLSLSAGALGVSFAFVTNFIDRGSMLAPYYLLGAWAAWTISVTAVLASHLTGVFAIRCAISDVDQRQPVTLRYNAVTYVLNITAGVLFLVGVLSITYFVWRNLDG